jgi:hypothetical protein
MDAANPTPAPEQPQKKDETPNHLDQIPGTEPNEGKPKVLVDFSITKLLSLVGAFVSLMGLIAFALSWIYVEDLSLELGFPFKQYFELIDYVQVTPSWMSVIIISTLISLPFVFAGVFKRIAESPIHTKFAATSATILIISLLVAHCSSETARKHLDNDSLSLVHCKSSQRNYEGLLIFQLNRYVIILAVDRLNPSTSIMAIPQAEVGTIETPSRKIVTSWRNLDTRPTLASPSPTLASPSPTLASPSPTLAGPAPLASPSSTPLK